MLFLRHPLNLLQCFLFVTKNSKTKFVSKSVFRLSRARNTVGPLINLKYMLILFSKLFFKIEKRKTEIDARFSFFWSSENEWPFDTCIIKVIK